MFHLTARVAWHDNRWNGTVCSAPSCNPFCVALDRIREGRDEAVEDRMAGRPWSKLKPRDLPPCKGESGAFMSPEGWMREFIHPYAAIKKVAKTHGHLEPTILKVPEFATFAVPFAWMLLSNQDEIDASLPSPLSRDEPSPLKTTAWVFGRSRQKELLDLFFGRLVPDKSLVFFYCKEGQPLGDTISRLIVGVGRITSIAPAKPYNAPAGKPTYLMWDRQFRHSIRADGHDGFLLPYHEYLEPTGDPDEDERRGRLLGEIAVAANPAHRRVFSYGAELANVDVALSTLVQCLQSVRKIREHGIVEGPWERREDWLNTQIASAWQERGAFPGMGSALEAFGVRLGTALSLELLSSRTVNPDDDPWPHMDGLLRGSIEPPQKAYKPDLEAVRAKWVKLPEERRALLRLLSRFALTPMQAKRWFEASKRNQATTSPVSDAEILQNPYRISETDLGAMNDAPVSIGTIDRGLLPDSTIAAKHPVEEPSHVGSSNDPRRARSAIVAVLRDAADDGYALLSATETLDRLERLDLSPPCNVGSDWPAANEDLLAGVVDGVAISASEDGGESISALQLADLKEREKRLRRILLKRSARPLKAITADWRSLLISAIEASGGTFDDSNPDHSGALDEQTEALERLTARRLTVLVGRAGTGKTSVLGAFLLCEQLKRDGILLLAPTGKARVRLGRATGGAEAMTVAQFLYRLDRYDGTRQRPLFKGGREVQEGKDRHHRRVLDADYG